MPAIYVIIASVLFGIFPTIQDHVMQTGVTPMGIVLSCNGIACLFSMLIAKRAGLSLKVTRNQLFHLGLIGVLVDPTTEGLSDSVRAMGYEEPWVDEPDT